ncbi:MAG TPA: serine/threonine-protein kinase, partial [Terriglobia bacterium]|nr:serine/threonine-protein kinase [Terriglobia bacterium]
MPETDWWEKVSPYLDQALEMTDAERAVWLASLREQDAELASHLETLLKEHHLLVEERFLEQSPLPATLETTLAGQTLGPYTLVSPISEGGMGSVWLAQRSDGRFQRRAAVKFLRASLFGRGGAERFRREGAILARLAHPHIAQLLDAGVSASRQPYYVLEYVEGQNIVEYADAHGLDVEARVRLFLDVLGAIEHAHSNLIVHRDIKPSNVLVSGEGEVKLLDFGIAKLLEGEGGSAAATELTREGGRALTPQYAAPEQITGGLVTTATDVYACGVLLYELLTGQHPLGPGPHSTADIVKAITETDAPRLSEAPAMGRAGDDAGRAAAHRATTPEKLRRQLRGDLETIVAKALKKEPAERYASAAAMADDLRRYLSSEPIRARPDTLAYRANKFARRNRVVLVLAALALTGSAAGAVSTWFQARTARAQRDFALRQLARAEALNDLNSFVLSDAAPSGKPLAIKDLIARSEHIVEQQKGRNDAARVELLISIGKQYGVLDDQ